MPDPVEMTVHRQPSTRSSLTWTPGLLRSAEILAQGGDLRLAAELCDEMRGDDRIKAVLETRTKQLVQLPLLFEASGDGRRRGVTVRALEADDDWYWMMPEAEHEVVHASGILLGVGLAELRWFRRGRRLLPKLHAWDPRHLRRDRDTDKWMLRIADGARGSREIEITPGDGKWVIYTPGSADQPWASGAFRALSRWMLLKKYAINDWGASSERYGMGVWTITGTGGTEQERRKLASDIQNMARNSVTMLPQGFELKLIESMARTHENFARQVAVADGGFGVAILGQNLTTQAGDTGNQGAAGVHERVSFGRAKSDNEGLSSVWREQVLRPWAKVNFGDPELAPWPMRDTDSLEDEQREAATRETEARGDATYVTAGIMTVNEVRALRGLPPIDGGDVLRSSSPTPSPKAA